MSRPPYPRRDPRLPARQPDPDRQARHRPRLRAQGRRQGRAEAAARANGPRRPAREAPPPRPARRASCRRCWSCASPAPTPRATSGPSPPSGRATAPPPRILIRTRRDDPALGAGDRLLGAHAAARTDPERAARRPGHPPHRHGAAPGASASTTRPRPAAASPPSTSAPTATGRSRPGDRAGAREGELVEAEQLGPARGHGLPRARIVARLGDPSAPKSVSLIAIHEHGIPDEFPDAALAEAEAARPVAARRPRGPARAAARHHRPRRRPRPRRRGPRPSRRRPGEPRRPRRLGRDRRRRPLRAPRHARSTARPAAAATPPTSPTASCRCCPSGCRATSARCIDGVDRPCIAVRMVLDADGHKRDHRFTRAPDALRRHPHLRPGAGRRRRPPGRRRPSRSLDAGHPPALGRLARRPPRPRRSASR